MKLLSIEVAFGLVLASITSGVRVFWPRYCLVPRVCLACHVYMKYKSVYAGSI